MTPTRKLLPLAEAQPPLFVGAALEGDRFSVGLIDDLGRPLCWQVLAAEIDRTPEAAAGQIAAAVLRAIEGGPRKPPAVARGASPCPASSTPTPACSSKRSASATGSDFRSVTG